MKPMPPFPSAEPSVDAEPPERADEELARISRRPDGYHWIARDGHQEFGPFDTLEQALAAMADAEDEGLEEGESLDEAQQELGLAGWVDPDTGAPAEATTVRLEDH